ncbi:hypothetical protein ICE98_00764 [Lactococcus lactis]|nr:hypothetical protein [Lactococcus lactis]
MICHILLMIDADLCLKQVQKKKLACFCDGIISALRVMKLPTHFSRMYNIPITIEKKRVLQRHFVAYWNFDLENNPSQSCRVFPKGLWDFLGICCNLAGCLSICFLENTAASFSFCTSIAGGILSSFPEDRISLKYNCKIFNQSLYCLVTSLEYSQTSFQQHFFDFVEWNLVKNCVPY